MKFGDLDVGDCFTPKEGGYFIKTDPKMAVCIEPGRDAFHIKGWFHQPDNKNEKVTRIAFGMVTELEDK